MPARKVLFVVLLAVALMPTRAFASDCCEAHDYPGCDSWNIESCVCAQDAWCCDNEWDNVCVDEVEELGCGSCSGIGPADGDCCESNGSPGCNNASVMNCVCAQDSYCCESQWDSVCADEVEEFGCGSCGGGEPDNTCPGYTGGSNCCQTDDPCGWGGDNICDCEGTCDWDIADCDGGGGDGDCCEDNDTPGCNNPAIQNCVCAQDAYCCDNKWDSVCVTEVEEFDCGFCGGGNSFCGDGNCDADEDCAICAQDCGACGGDGDCCIDNGTPGCIDPAIESCVCAQDSYCCETEWDQICANEVEEHGCGDCGGSSEDCPGYVGSSSCCKITDPCGWADDNLCDCDGTCNWDLNDCDSGPTCGDGWCDGDEDCVICPQDCGDCQGDGDCCQDNGTPGCDSPAIQACVCADDAYCCDTKWDAVCAEEVEELGCGDCSAGPSDTCPGYDGVSTCCKTDNPCGWADDNICDCAGTCSWDTGDCGGGDQCGNGNCDGAETCESCPEDCGFCGGDGDCCTSNETPGCDEAAIQDCVCAEDSYCCATKWDNICAGEVESMGCGDCSSGPVCGDGNCDAGEDCEHCPDDCGACGGTGGCCEEQDVPGCNDPTIQACVCAEDSFCCEFAWDSICVDEVEEFGCGSCSGGGCGDALCEDPEDCLTCPDDCGPCAGSGCCEEHDTAGCDDQAIQSCVCAEDAYCCDVKWDGICVNEVTSLECGNCDGGGPVCGDGECQGGENCEVCPEDCGPCQETGDCCEAHDTPGCADPAVQACVCEADAFCCENHWDEICVDEVEGEGCGSCAPCQPQCAGKECGPDTCGGSCGTCQADFSCQNGKCVDTGCQPQCAGKECGPDGCGGTCGECEQGKNCNNGKCVGGCQPDCTGKQCGSDGCGGTCGQCAPGFFCNEGHCQTECEPDCMGKKCGPDTCGGTCGSCPPNFFCDADGHCNQECIPNCSGKQCGGDGCGGSCGSCPPGMVCSNGHCASDCTPDCGGKQCGDNGCGGTCGTCPPGDYCNLQGHCVSDCVPNCVGKQCGADGCNGSCGSCGFDEQCVNGQCTESCIPNCMGKECGTNGCGGECGICGGGQFCSADGQCVSCEPDCMDRECGDDGCGGDCGACNAKDQCDEETGLCLAPEDPYSYIEVEGDAMSWNDSYAPGTNTPCDPGERLVYGKCVAEEGSDGGKDVDSSCSVSARPSSGAMWLLLALFAVLGWRRRSA